MDGRLRPPIGNEKHPLDVYDEAWRLRDIGDDVRAEPLLRRMVENGDPDAGPQAAATLGLLLLTAASQTPPWTRSGARSTRGIPRRGPTPSSQVTTSDGFLAPALTA